MITVFLGGTCNNSTWRDQLQLLLVDAVHAFNPVVADWNEEAQANEDAHRASDDFVLYAITPRMLGSYSIAEATDDSNKRPEKTLFVVLEQDGLLSFEKHQFKSLVQTAKLIAKNGGYTFTSLLAVADFLNQKA